MKAYVFLTTEGYTFQPDSESSEPDIENLQVLGIARGVDQQNAFNNLLQTTPNLVTTTFNETFCLQLDNNYLDSKKYFCISTADERRCCG
jgi:hypothetical protein